eukprot:scaffold301226_cov50-Prasinocladus_malaysianus.AAC.1
MEGRFNKTYPSRIGGFDLIIDNNQMVGNSDWPGMPSGLGLQNDRIKALEKLQKQQARANQQ